MAVRLLSDTDFKEEELKGVAGNPQAFMMDMKHIQDINSFYETPEGYFCSASAFPLPKFFWISKTDGNIRSLHLMGEDGLLGNLTVRRLRTGMRTATPYWYCSACNLDEWHAERHLFWRFHSLLFFFEWKTAIFAAKMRS